MLAVAWLACVQAQAACVLRIAYPNTDAPPYYLGSGGAVQEPPGASVDLIREIAAGGGCTITSMTRLPPLRMQTTLEADQLDAAPMTAPKDGSAKVAFPLDRHGNPDPERALRTYIVVFVRAADKLARDTDPGRLLVDKKVGINHGSTLGPLLRQAGIIVDDGATEMARNLDKLQRKRVDAFVVSAANMDDMDATVAARFGGTIVRLDKPLRVSSVWLATSKSFYQANPAQVEAMWAWIGANAARRFAEILKKYEQAP